MLIGSIPPKGIPMPFISAGGTSLSVFMGAIGILCNVGKGREIRQKVKKRKFDLNLFKKDKNNINKI